MVGRYGGHGRHGGGGGVGGMGSGGSCVCVACGEKVPHRPGTPCMEERCPKCGKVMFREGSAHHQAALEKMRSKKSG